METTSQPADELYWCLKETSDGVPLGTLQEALRKKNFADHQINRTLDVALEQGVVRFEYSAGGLGLWLTEEKPLPLPRHGISDKLAWFVRSRGPVTPVEKIYENYCGRFKEPAEAVSASLHELLGEKVLWASSSLHHRNVDVALGRPWQFTVFASDAEAAVVHLRVRGGTREIVERKVHRKYSSLKILAISEAATGNWLREGGDRLEPEFL
jgi:hypothetical protein